ncbi:DUF6192 family protein [Streptomyces sp. NPDC006368]|uniref:DUF6192 family protein n=1 Tax=Streptomyces sp. NPDC006368 TaxID=3156760 RepID=UPI0033B6FBA6
MRCGAGLSGLDGLVPRMRDQEFTDDGRETIRRGSANVRSAADWLEAGAGRRMTVYPSPLNT